VWDDAEWMRPRVENRRVPKNKMILLIGAVVSFRLGEKFAPTRLRRTVERTARHGRIAHVGLCG